MRPAIFPVHHTANKNGNLLEVTDLDTAMYLSEKTKQAMEMFEEMINILFYVFNADF